MYLEYAAEYILDMLGIYQKYASKISKISPHQGWEMFGKF